MPSSLLTQIRALGEQHFRHIAAALRPLLPVLGTSVLEEHAKTVIRAYMAQAVALPIAWENLENLLVSGALAEHGKDSAVAENAARVVMARAVLVALLHGQAKNWATQEMVQAHVLHRPSPVFLRSTEFTQLSATCAKAAALAASLRLPGAAYPARLPHGTRALAPLFQLTTPASGSFCPPLVRRSIPSTSPASTPSLPGGCRHRGPSLRGPS